MFQSTPSREGDRLALPRPMIVFLFQSTPSREGDLRELPNELRYQKFQSTPSREGDPDLIHQFISDVFVSIHALARGRPRTDVQINFMNTFQSTPSREGDNLDIDYFDHPKVFQSTPSREGDQRQSPRAG